MATTFGSWLKQRRKELGVPQEEFAERIGCSVSLLSKLESGERQPSNQVAQVLAEYLRIPQDEREAFVAFARGGQLVASSSRPPEAVRQGFRSEAVPSTSGAPWRAAYRHFTNLPSSLIPLIGREQEMASIRDQMLSARTRLLTLTGAPGIGKTSLALQSASGLLTYFEDGVFFVDLAPIADPLLVLSAMARTLGLADDGKGAMPTDRLLLNHLRGKRLLLVLDNFEHVLDAAYHLIALMEGSPWLKILATSREPLYIKGERRFPVPPLTSPGPQQLPPLDDLDRYSSVELFVERARMSEPDFALSEQNAAPVARICLHLDGLPLAIELAAGQVSFLSPHEIEKRLNERLQFLKAREQHLPERQRSLRGALDSSHNLLNEDEKALFRRLGVFEAGFTFDAAEAVCGESPGSSHGEQGYVASTPSGIAEPLRILLDKSLVSQAQTARAERRFAMLETIREYALEHLYTSGEAGTISKRHGDYYLCMAQEAATHLHGPDQAQWLDAVEAEHDNMNAALRVLFAPRHRSDQVEEETREDEVERVATGARLCMALYSFWDMRGYYKEGRMWFEEAIGRIEALAGQADSDLQETPAREPVDSVQLSSDLYSLLGTMFSGAGNLAYFQSNYVDARALHEASLAIRRRLGDKAGIGSSLGNLGNAAMDQGDYAGAVRYHSESLALARELGNDLKICTCLNNLGISEFDQGNFVRARSLLEESLLVADGLGDAEQMGRVLNNLGIVMRYQGDYAEARRCLDRALALQDELGMKRASALTLVNIAFVARDQGEYDEARRDFLEGLSVVWEAGDSRVASECLDGLASIEAVNGDAERAARLFGCAEALREAILAPITPAERKSYEEYLARARARLDEDTWSLAWQKGHATPVDDVTRQLLAGRS